MVRPDRAALLTGVVAALGLSVVSGPANGASAPQFEGVAVISRGDLLGTGFFVEEDLVVTADHVVDGDGVISVKASGGTAEGRIVAVDEDLDLALVQTSARGKVLSLADGEAAIGDQVFAVGAAKGTLSLTRGIVSGFRTVDGLEYVQTDAAINSGNSGGPLLDEDGDVVGIVVSRLTDAEGIGLAVKVAQAADFLDARPTTSTDGTDTTPGTPGSSADDDGFPVLPVGAGAGVVVLLGLLLAILVRRRSRRPSTPPLVISRAELGLPPEPTSTTKGPTHVHD